MSASRRHRQSIRLPQDDYRQPGAYFVTVCTHGREPLFGNIVSGILHLSEAGQIAQSRWEEIPLHFPEARLDAFVVMPNHVHGIVIITGSPDVGATHASPLPQMNRMHPGPKPRSLGAIVGSFKAAATKRINGLRGTPGTPVWQRNYYERVIRNERELAAVREYIALNPLQWELDPERPCRLKGDACVAPVRQRKGKSKRGKGKAHATHAR